MPDYYQVLEVDPSATTEEIRSAYRRAAMRWHPDRNAGSKESEEKFKEIARAYSILSDTLTRRQYDQQRLRGEDGSTSEEPEFSYERAEEDFLREMYTLAGELTMQNVPWQRIGQALADKGCPPSVANEIAFAVEAYRKSLVRKAATRAFAWALLWVALGGIVTGCTYATAEPGGTYIVTWGLFVFGG
jgi:curved DNA-binding protein CbpA